MKGFLILEDGTVFEGQSAGVPGEVVCELSTHNAMGGFVELLSDPAWLGQALCLTYPLVGNPGVCREDMESERIWLKGLIVKEISRRPSNFRCDLGMPEFLKAQGVVALEGIDTRALAKRLRGRGRTLGVLTTADTPDVERAKAAMAAYEEPELPQALGQREKRLLLGHVCPEENGPVAGAARFVEKDYVAGIREKKPHVIKDLFGKGKKVAVLDLGARRSLLAGLTARGFDVHIYAGTAPAEALLEGNPDGLLVAGGPGNPFSMGKVVDEVEKLCSGGLPLWGVGLGHVLLALAHGGRVERMARAHGGGNLPVLDVEGGQILITGQNHLYSVDGASLAGKARETHRHIQDGSNEGLSYGDGRVWSTAFYPASDKALHPRADFFARFCAQMS